MKDLFFSYVDSTRRLAVNLSGGAGEDLKKMIAEHNLVTKEDHTNDGRAILENFSVRSWNTIYMNKVLHGEIE